MSEQTKSGIYIITNTETGDCYIGSAIDVEKRMTQHRYLLRLGNHHARRFQQAWDQFGEDAFVFDILEIVPDIRQLLQVEQRYLDEQQPQYNSAQLASRNSAGIVTDPAMVGKGTQAKIAGIVGQVELMMRINKELAQLRDFAHRSDDIVKILQATLILSPSEVKVIHQYRSLAAIVYEWGIVSGREFIEFMNEGFRGLYEGETMLAVAGRKHVRIDELADYMGTIEGVGNMLRDLIVSQRLIEYDGEKTFQQANRTHYEAGRTVRGWLTSEGIYPEDLPTPTKSYKQIVKEEAARIAREEEDAHGLWGTLPSGDDGES